MTEKYYSDSRLNKLANDMVGLMPNLRQFYGSSETLAEYSKRISLFKTHPLHLKRQILFKELINEKINKIFNAGELDKIKFNLDDRQGLEASIIDHHAILNYPFHFLSHLIPPFHKLFENKIQNILTFGTGNVSLNEPFTRRGFMFHNHKINLYNRRDKNKLVYATPKQNFDFVNNLIKTGQWHDFNEQEQLFLVDINLLLQNIDYNTCEFVGDQITKINYYLWPKLFCHELQKIVPNLISLEYDSVVIKYLINCIQSHKESFIYQILFDRKFREYVARKFHGVVGAWNDKRKSGTYFFWGINEAGERVRLVLNDKILESADGITINISEQEIIENLEKRRILPGMFLKFALIIFYMGLRPYVGLASTEYLNRMKDIFIQLLEQYPEEAEAIKTIKVDSIISLALAFHKDADEIKQMHAFDVIYESGISEEYFKKLAHIHLKNLMAPLLIFYYYAEDKYAQGIAEIQQPISLKVLHSPLEELFTQ